MKKTLYYSLFVLSCSALILSACSKNSPAETSSQKEQSQSQSQSQSETSQSSEPVVPDVFEEKSFDDYMAALEGKSFNDGPYQKCIINGTVDDYAESENLATFNDEPIRFIGDITRPSYRSQNEYEVAEYGLDYVMGFAKNWSKTDEAKFYVNNGNKDASYKVEIIEPVSAEAEAKTTYIYNSLGFTTSIKSVIADASATPIMGRALFIQPMKDLTFEWLEKDTIDSYERISYTAFHEKALAFESAECSYNSGHVNGTLRYCNSETVNTLTNELIVRGGTNRFQSINYTSEMANLFHNAASFLTESTLGYFYYSESLDSLMVITYMVADLGDVIERTIVWNNNGLPTSAKDNTYGYIGGFGSTTLYDITLSYSNDEATVTLTILPGIGAWTDESASKTVTVTIGTLLGAAMSTFVMPTCAGMVIYGNALAKENGQLMPYNEPVLDDLTLVVPFYNNAGSPTILTFSNTQTIGFEMQGFTSSGPMIAYAPDGTNTGFYFASGDKHRLDFSFKETKAPVTSKTMYFYGANVSLGDVDGYFAPANCNLISVTLNGDSTVGDYAFARTNVETVSVNAAGIGKIGAHAFHGCNYLRNFYCGSIGEIGAYAFYQSGLTGVFSAAKNATVIGERAFDGCGNLSGVLVNSTLSYLESTSLTGGPLNSFKKDEQTIPAGWDTNWNGSAKAVYELADSSFLHEGTAVDVGWYVGGQNGEETITFAMFLANERLYTIHTFIQSDGDVTVSALDGTEIIKATSEGTGNYDKTIEGVVGGQWVIVKVHGLESLNSNGYFFRFTQEHVDSVSLNYNSTDYLLDNASIVFDADALAGSQEFLYIDSVGTEADATEFASLISGKIVLVNRGEISFTDKGNNLAPKGPKAIICVNNMEGTDTMNISGYTGEAPYYMAPKNLGNAIKANATKQTKNGIDYYVGTFIITVA